MTASDLTALEREVLDAARAYRLHWGTPRMADYRQRFFALAAKLDAAQLSPIETMVAEKLAEELKR